DLFPLAGGVVFHVAGADLVEVRLAHVVQQRADGEGLPVVPLGEKVLHHRVVHVDAVHHQPLFAGAVELGGCRRPEKVGAFQPFQQPVGAGAGDGLGEQVHKLLMIVFHHRSISSRMPFSVASSSRVMLMPLPILLPSGPQSRMSYLRTLPFQLTMFSCRSQPLALVETTAMRSVISYLNSAIMQYLL